MIKIQAGVTVDAGALLSGFSWAKVGQAVAVADPAPVVKTQKTELAKKRSVTQIVDEFLSNDDDSVDCLTIDNTEQFSLTLDTDI